jgi:hypothetical protein
MNNVGITELPWAPARKTQGRLRRRSLEEITKVLEQVVALVKTKGQKRATVYIAA